jgi:hypothetical protein
MARKVVRRSANGMGLELWLSWILLGMLGAMMAWLAVTYGPAWLQLGRAALVAHGLANPWLLALVFCIALPAALGRLTPNRPPTHAARRLG